jgi:FixJ family two-component response regulator
LAVDEQHCIVAVVDDDPRVRESLESLLDSAGIETKSFKSAEDVLRPGGLKEICCLITDVRMPGMDGCELQRRVKTSRPILPIIFVTAHHDDEIRQHALNQGAFAFLYKPFDGEELLLAVDAALQRGRNTEIHP